jgi:hypothetical protein
MASKGKSPKGIPRRIFSSDKCDFVVRGQILYAPDLQKSTGSELDVTLKPVNVRASSSKCDFQVVSQAAKVLPPFKGTIIREEKAWRVEAQGERQLLRASSAKCDFRLSVSTEQQQRGRSTKPRPPEFHHELRRQAGSSKCDWQLKVQEPERSITASTKGVVMQALVTRPGFEGRVASSKCDWALQVGALDVKGLPQLRSVVSSSKCDFSLRVEFGVEGGRTFRLRAASAKCDFRLEKLESSDNGKSWSAMPVKPTDRKS